MKISRDDVNKNQEDKKANSSKDSASMNQGISNENLQKVANGADASGNAVSAEDIEDIPQAKPDNIADKNLQKVANSSKSQDSADNSSNENLQKVAKNNSSEGRKVKRKRKRRPFKNPCGLEKAIGAFARFVVICGMLGLACFAVLQVCVIGYVVSETKDESVVLSREAVDLSQTTIFYAKNSKNEWEVYQTYSRAADRTWVDLEEIPDNLKWAIICTEDKNFYEEPGVQFNRTIAAIVDTVLKKLHLGGLFDSTQGASTIEQQLIKNITGDDSQDATRKMREIFRALALDKNYTKDTILEYYCNVIPLTGRIAGVEAGAQAYFGKHVSELTLAECAQIAGITKNPTKYSPYNTEDHLERRNFILYNMYDQGKITEAEYNEAINSPIGVVNKTEQEADRAVSKNNSTEKKQTSDTTYFADAAFLQLKKDLMEQYGYDEDEATNAIYEDGLRVYLTIDIDLQNKMDDIMKDHEYFEAGTYQEEVSQLSEYDLPVYEKDGKTLKTSEDDDGNTVYYRYTSTEAAMVTMNYGGEVLAMTGGIGTKQATLGTNRALDPHQTGSSIKPLGAYPLAIEYGLANYTTNVQDSYYYKASDKKVVNVEYCLRNGLNPDPNDHNTKKHYGAFRNWPSNASGRVTYGNIPVYKALANSVNTVAVKLGSYVGADILYDFQKNILGFEYLVEEDADLGPLTLGSQSYGVTPLEEAAAYQILDGTGVYTTPHYYSQVTDSEGNTVIDMNRAVVETQAISPSTQTIMNKMLQNVVKWGTAAGMEIEAGDMPSAAKTGTTNDYKGLTFVGMTPYYVTSVWYGYDTPENLKDHVRSVQSKNLAKPWKELMEHAQKSLPYKDFAVSDDVIEKRYAGVIGYYTEDNMP